MAIYAMTSWKHPSGVIGTTPLVGANTGIPLPHPSGASAWIYGPGNRDRLVAALQQIGKYWGDFIGTEAAPH